MIKLPTRAISNAVNRFSKSNGNGFIEIQDSKIVAINALYKIYEKFRVQHWGEDEALDLCNQAVKLAVDSLDGIQEALELAAQTRRDEVRAELEPPRVTGQYDRELARMRCS